MQGWYAKVLTFPYRGGCVVCKRSKTPLHNIKMAPSSIDSFYHILYQQETPLLTIFWVRRSNQDACILELISLLKKRNNKPTNNQSRRICKKYIVKVCSVIRLQSKSIMHFCTTVQKQKRKLKNKTQILPFASYCLSNSASKVFFFSCKDTICCRVVSSTFQIVEILITCFTI